jgi:ubiquinone/menaquinone biosynthesis C-methylase UbiE
MIEEASIEERAGAIAYEELWVPALFGQWAQIVAEEANIEPVHRVLDVACGTGVLTREVASRLNNSSQVTGVDSNPGMLSVAMGYNSEIEWKQGSAEKLPFRDHHFNVVVCQFGLMFFSDRVRAIKEMLRVLAPDGRLVMTVWDALENIPAYSKSVSTIERYGGKKARKALNNPFELGDKDILRATLSEAGISDITITTHAGTARFPDLKSMLDADLRGWLPVLGIMLGEEDIQEIYNDASDALVEYISPNGNVSFNITAHVVTYQAGHVTS